MVGLAFRPSMTMTGVIVRIRTETTTATCAPKTAAIPSLAIQEGWKYPTEKPLAVRQALMIAETTVDWSGYFSRLYAVIELLHIVISSSSHTVGKRRLTLYWRSCQTRPLASQRRGQSNAYGSSGSCRM